MAKIMMTIVAVFILLSIPKVILALFEVSTIPNILDCHQRQCRYYVSSERWVADSIIRYLVMLNSSINFIIYCFLGSKFRQTLLSSFQGLCGSSEVCSHAVHVHSVQVESLTKKKSEHTPTADHEAIEDEHMMEAAAGLDEKQLVVAVAGLDDEQLPLQITQC